MGGVIDGKPLNAAYTNTIFLFKNGDDSTLYKFGLLSAVAGYGSSIVNCQREFNAIDSYTGMTVGSVYNVKPSWTSNNFGTPTDSLFDRIDAIDAGVLSSVARRGNVSISSGATSITVSFSSAWEDSNYVPIFNFSCSDSPPIFLQGMISSKSTSGFTIVFNAAVDSSNYKINYSVGDEI